jgi:hypothetical protein
MRYWKSQLDFWDLSDVNSQDTGWRRRGKNMTGTGLVAATDIVRCPFGGFGTQYNGTDERSGAGDIGNVRSLDFLVSPDTTSEQLIILDTGKTITVSGGTITYTGITATATYVAGLPSVVLVAGKWQHVVCVLNADVDANTFGTAYDGSNYGAISVAKLAVYSVALNNLQAADLWAARRQIR